MQFTTKRLFAIPTSSRRCSTKMVTRYISAAHRFPGRATRSFSPRPLAGEGLGVRVYRKVCQYCATSAFTHTAPVSCAPTDRWLQHPSSILKHWNSCARCITATKSACTSPSTPHPAAWTPSRICRRCGNFFLSKQNQRRIKNEIDTTGRTWRRQRHPSQLHQGKIQYPANLHRRHAARGGQGGYAVGCRSQGNNGCR